MTAVPGLQVYLRTPENGHFAGLCTDLDAREQELVALVAFRPDTAPAIGLGERTQLTFLGGGLVSSIGAEATTVMRSDDHSQRCYSFTLADVPRSMLLLLANRRSTTRLSPRGPVRIDLLDLPAGVPVRVALHDISPAGVSILVDPAVEAHLRKHVRLRFALMLPGEDPIELAAAIRHRRILKSQVLYGLDFDDQLPAFSQAQGRLLAYLSALR